MDKFNQSHLSGEDIKYLTSIMREVVSEGMLSGDAAFEEVAKRWNTTIDMKYEIDVNQKRSDSIENAIGIVKTL